MTEHKNNNEVTLSCSVSTYGQCRQTVKWVYQGKDVDKDNKDLKTSQSTCSATVSFLTSHYICTSNHELLKCEVTNPNSGKVQLYNFSPQLSCEKPGEKMMSCLKSLYSDMKNDKTAFIYLMYFKF